MRRKGDEGGKRKEDEGGGIKQEILYCEDLIEFIRF